MSYILELPDEVLPAYKKKSILKVLTFIRENYSRFDKYFKDKRLKTVIGNNFFYSTPQDIDIQFLAAGALESYPVLLRKVVFSQKNILNIVKTYYMAWSDLSVDMGAIQAVNNVFYPKNTRRLDDYGKIIKVAAKMILMYISIKCKFYGMKPQDNKQLFDYISRVPMNIDISFSLIKRNKTIFFSIDDPLYSFYLTHVNLLLSLKEYRYMFQNFDDYYLSVYLMADFYTYFQFYITQNINTTDNKMNVSMDLLMNVEEVKNSLTEFKKTIAFYKAESIFREQSKGNLLGYTEEPLYTLKVNEIMNNLKIYQELEISCLYRSNNQRRKQWEP
uniref:Uncharacterized protein n=1 Tax=Parastrongyloides trichosuri TaxID=131310 RepID=A0A0N4ZBP2_PARTI